jgi:hypothetical protein
MSRAPDRQVPDGIGTIAAAACLLCLLLGPLGAHPISLAPTAGFLGELSFRLIEWVRWLVACLPLAIWLVADLLLLRAWLSGRAMSSAKRAPQPVPLSLDQLR